MAHTVHRPAATAGSTATLNGQVGAIQWNDDHTEIRLYCPTNEASDNVVKEYRWEGGDPWNEGKTLASSSPKSRAAAVHWQEGGDAHLRVYYQDTGGLIREVCYDTPKWTDGQILTGALPETAIAAIALYKPSDESIHLFLYYQAANGQIIEQYWDGSQANGWVTIAAFQGAISKSGIAAVYFVDEAHNPHKRLYYQDANNLIIEQCWDGSQWARGHTFTDAVANTAIAASHWWDTDDDSSHVRLYYRNGANSIIEQCYDTPVWNPGQTFDGVTTSTGIAAVAWRDSDVHLRVYYEDTTKALIEQCYDEGVWTRGTFVATVG